MSIHRKIPLADEGLGRRTFITDGLKWTAALTLAGFPAVARRGKLKNPSIGDIMKLIIDASGAGNIPSTVDTLKCGHAGDAATGVICTMFPTIPIIEEAVRRKINFIIAHEPSFYNHTDDKNWVPGNRIVAEKLELLNQHGIAIWRCHDYWHAMNPDGITMGVVRAAGWEPYYHNQPVLEIPRQPLRQVVEHLKKALNISEVRVIGDPDQPCKRVALLPGAWGGQRQIAIVEKENPDLLIVGEVHEWETAEYIRDRNALGHKTAMIDLGHSVSEEPGMDWMAQWLGPQLTPLPVVHIPSNNPFTFM